MTRRSDLESILYSLFAAFRVKLPWHGLKADQKEDHIQRRREAFEDRQVFWEAMKVDHPTLPEEMKKFFDAIAKLEPDDIPKYEELAKILSDTSDMPPEFYTWVATYHVVMKGN
jgi:hypothetical protein